MKHAWLGFVALASGAVFLWLGAELISPRSADLQTRPTSKGATVQWDYRQLALEWRSEDAVVRDIKVIPVSNIEDYYGAYVASGSMKDSKSTDYVLVLIPTVWAMIAAGLLPMIWVVRKLRDIYTTKLVAHWNCTRCGHECKAGIDTCPICGELHEMPEGHLA